MTADAKTERLERFLALDPGNPELLRDLARAYHQDGDQDKALELCARLAKLEGETAAILNLMASARLARGQWDEAVALLTKAVALDAGTAPLHFNLGYAELARGRAAEAVRALERAVALDPTQARFFTHLNLARDAAGDMEGARQALAKALDLEPGNVEASALAVYEELEAGRIDDARRRADAAAQRNPQSPEALRLRAEVALLALDPQSALADLRRAIELRPDDAHLRLTCGQALLALRRLGEAEQALQQATALDADLVEAYIGLGWARLFQGNASGAKEAFSRALSRARTAEAHAGMAFACAREERMPECERELRVALALDPRCATALWLRAGLARLSGDPAGAQILARELLDDRSAGPAGWSVRELLARAASSPIARAMRASTPQR